MSKLVDTTKYLHIIINLHLLL